MEKRIAIAKLTMEFDFADFENWAKKPRTQKARIKELMPAIEDVRAQGYYLCVIFGYLKEKKILSGSIKTFRCHYNWFRNNPEMWKSDRSDQGWKPTIVRRSGNAQTVGFGKEEPEEVRGGDEHDYGADERLANRIFASKK